MGHVRETWRRLRLLWGGRFERGLDEELRFHVDRQTEKNRRAGMPPAEARRRALIAFGGVERAKERTRDQVRLVGVEQLVRDLRHAGRGLLRAPGFTGVAVLTLALGIGATTAMFSVVDGVLLRPLPYPAQERLVELTHEAPALGLAELYASPSVYFGYRDYSRTLEAVGLWDWDGSPTTVAGAGPPEAIASVEVTHEVLGLLGASPILGREFTEADDRPGSPPTVLIAHSFWQRRFDGVDPVGATLVVDGVPREVIGVLPAWFRFFDYPAEIFYPLQLVRAEAAFPSGDGRGIARLRPGVTLEEANADLARLVPILDEEFPGADAAAWGYGPRLRWLKEMVVGDLDDTLWLLMGTIGCLLLIACANVANLVLVRTETRRPEFAVRAALGAGWGSLARLVFAEGALLGLAGGLGGVGVASLSLPALLSIGAIDLPAVMTVRLDPRVLLVTLGISLLAVLVFGFFPLLHLGRRWRRPANPLRGGGRSTTGAPESHRVHHLLLVAQVALTIVLLVGSGLMLRTFQTLRAVDPGFQDAAGVQTFQLTIPAASLPADPAGAPDTSVTVGMQRQLLEAVAAVPGVTSAGFSSANDGLPLDGDGRFTAVFVEGRPPVAPVAALKETQSVSPWFFETLGTRLLAGRTFDWADIEGERPVVLVSENLARVEWGSPAAALGRRVGPDPSGPWSEVVGVVADVRHDGVDQPAPQVVVFPAAASETATFVARSGRAGTSAFLEELRAAVQSVSPALAPANIGTLGDLYRRSMARTTTTLQLLAIAGLLALALGVVGVYGVVGYAVTQRRREIGIRVALGARPGEVRRLFVRRALLLVATGAAIGLGAAAGLTRLVELQLFGVGPLDPAVYAAVTLLLLAAAWLASDLAARRGSALDPARVLQDGA